MTDTASEQPIELFLAAYPEETVRLAEQLRALVKRALPEALERMRPGWRLIGYDVPVGRRKRSFAYVAPQPGHVHLGFEYGAWLDDPQGLLEGAHLRLRQVRYLTYRPGDELPEATVMALIRDAARVAQLSPANRVAMALDRQAGPPRRR